MTDRVEISLSPRPEFVGAVRHVLGALGRLAEFSADSVEDLKLAVSEAVTNAITRQGLAEAGAEVAVVATRLPGAVAVEVTDSAPFDPEALDDGASPDGEPSSQEFSFEAGLSLPVVRGLVEDLEIAPAGESNGMTVRFTIRTDPAEG